MSPNFSLGTLSNLDDEPSGRRPEVFSRSRQLLRMSVMSSTWRSGRDICWFAVLRWTWAFKAIFDVSVPILPCLIPMFEKRKPFLYFLPMVGPLEERFREIFGKPWAVVFNDFGEKEPVSKSKMFMFSLNASLTVIRFQKHYLTRKGKGIDIRDPCMKETG